jgi:hypothetical protein
MITSVNYFGFGNFQMRFSFVRPLSNFGHAEMSKENMNLIMYALFNNVVSRSEHIASNDRIINSLRGIEGRGHDLMYCILLTFVWRG